MSDASSTIRAHHPRPLLEPVLDASRLLENP